MEHLLGVKPPPRRRADCNKEGRIPAANALATQYIQRGIDSVLGPLVLHLSILNNIC